MEIQALENYRIGTDVYLSVTLKDNGVSVNWTPDTVPALFTEVSVEEWPAWRQPTGVQDSYNTGDKVSHNGQHWQSLVDANVWEPSDAVPTLWQKITQ